MVHPMRIRGIEFDASEVHVLRELTDEYAKGSRRICLRDVEGFIYLADPYSFRDELLQLQAFEGFDSDHCGTAREGMVAIVEALNAPVDYPAAVTRWFRSRLWSIVAGVFCTTPA